LKYQKSDKRNNDGKQHRNFNCLFDPIVVFCTIIVPNDWDKTSIQTKHWCQNKRLKFEINTDNGNVNCSKRQPFKYLIRSCNCYTHYQMYHYCWNANNRYVSNYFCVKCKSFQCYIYFISFAQQNNRYHYTRNNPRCNSCNGCTFHPKCWKLPQAKD